jgi:hypothetical protein
MARCTLTYVGEGEYLEASPIRLISVQLALGKKVATILTVEKE